MISTDDNLGTRIYHLARLTGEFTLRSGARSTEYFDKYRFESEPAVLRAIAARLRDLVPPDTELLAGLELGGIPLATALSLATGIPAVFVRKQPKSYGTGRFAEGAEIAGRHLLIVEDVVTLGGQIKESVAALRASGAIITHAVCVIDRETGGADNLRQSDVTLSSVFTLTDLLRQAEVAEIS